MTGKPVFKELPMPEKTTPFRLSFAVIPLMLLTAGFVIFLTHYASGRPSVQINEVCTNNFSVYTDLMTTDCDYIELYNTSSRSVCLSGFTLCTGSEDDDIFLFGDITLAGGAYLLLFPAEDATAEMAAAVEETCAAKLVDTDSCGYLSLPFSLSKNGETLYLRRPNGRTMDFAEVPALRYNTVYARLNGSWMISTATPERSNETGTPVPAFDAAAFSAEMAAAPAYSYDALASSGSLPSAQILSLSVPKDSLYGKDGIFLPENAALTGRAAERECRADFFYEQGSSVASQAVGIRVSPSATLLSRPDLRLYARSVYDGNSAFSLFPDFSEKDRDRLLLRYDGTKEYRLMQALAPLGLPFPEAAACSLFINGAYYGEYLLTEDPDTAYLASRYSLDAEDIALLSDLTQESGCAYSGLTYRSLIAYADTHDLRLAEHFSFLCGNLDMESLLTCYAVQIYLNNTNFSPYDNSLVWRSEVIDDTVPCADGKWRYLITGLDAALLDSSANADPLENPFSAVCSADTLFAALLENPDFCDGLYNCLLALSRLDFSGVSDGDSDAFFDGRFAFLTEMLAAYTGREYSADANPSFAAAGTALIRPADAPADSYAVAFSRASGFYDAPFSLKLTAPEGFTVYYTTDGSLPGADAIPYTGPISVTEPRRNAPSSPAGSAVVIRAVAIDAANVSTPTASATYFIGCNSDTYDSSSVISLILEPDALFDPDTGIYVTGSNYDSFVAAGGNPDDYSSANFMQTGSLWERAAHLDYFDAQKNYVFSQETGLRINGSSSRLGTQKSLRLYARKKYDGSSRFTYSFFEDDIPEKSVILRSGSFANHFLPSLVQDRNIGTQKYAPCAVFINGEFWGHYYLTERFSPSYMEAYHHVNADNVTIVKDGTLLDGSETIYDAYNRLEAWLTSNDLSLAENYDYICSKIDIESYIDYYCTQIYCNNYDFSERKNSLVWRSNDADPSNPYADNRWRYALTDLDYTLSSYGGANSYATNSFTNPPPNAVVVQTEEPFFKALLANADFRQQFVTTFMDLENENFAPERVREKMAECLSFIDYPAVWEEYFTKRPDYINPCLAEVFSLNGTLTDVTLRANDPAAGLVRLNSIRPDLDGGWTGRYFTDYPVTVTALPADGYFFKERIVNGTSCAQETLTVPLLAEGNEITAVFEPEISPAP